MGAFVKQLGSRVSEIEVRMEQLFIAQFFCFDE